MKLNSFEPTIIFCVSGKVHLIYAIWSISSLKSFGYNTIEVIVSNEGERQLLWKYWPDVVCNIISIDQLGYPAFSYKPFALTKYLDKFGIYYKNRDIVICDADILWKNNPANLFDRFKNMNWVHKITAINPTDYEIPLDKVRPSYISLRTILNYESRYEISAYPDFVVNAGLFKLSEKVFPLMLERWMEKILKMPAHEMLMSEALMSLTYAEMGLVPVSDYQDIKHYGRHTKGDQFKKTILSFDQAETLKSGEFTGYQTAKHYFGDQRLAMHKDAVAMGLDQDNLVQFVDKELRNKNRQHLKEFPAKFFRSLGKINPFFNKEVK